MIDWIAVIQSWYYMIMYQHFQRIFVQVFSDKCNVPEMMVAYFYSKAIIQNYRYGTDIVLPVWEPLQAYLWYVHCAALSGGANWVYKIHVWVCLILPQAQTAVMLVVFVSFWTDQAVLEIHF